MIKHVIKKTLLHFGYEIRRASSDFWLPGRGFWYADYIKRLNFSVNTVFDIGVGAKGTPELYKAFPNAFFILIDPLREFEATMKDILSTYNGCYFITALGSREETRTMHINPLIKERSSFHAYKEIEILPFQTAQRDLPVTTLDILNKEHCFKPPFGLKIDTEGFEYLIIESSQDVLKQTEFVIAEVSVAQRLKQVYLFEDFISLMKRNGFRVCDILDIGRAPDTEIIFFDLVFRKY